MANKATTNKKKRTSKSKAKDQSDKPKRPLSAYNLFFRYQRNKILHETSQPSYKPRRSHGKIGFAALARTVAEEWKAIDPIIKSQFDAKAREEKEKYEKDVDAWNRARVAKMTSYCPQASTFYMPLKTTLATTTAAAPPAPMPVQSITAALTMAPTLSMNDKFSGPSDACSFVSFDDDEILDDTSDLLREAVGICDGDEPSFPPMLPAIPLPVIDFSPMLASSPGASLDSIVSSFDDECFNILSSFKTIR